MRARRWCSVLMVGVLLSSLLPPYAAAPAHAAANEASTFMFDNTTTFNGPNLDMIQGYTPAGAASTCPGAPGSNWTCTWSSDTFAAGQALAAGTTTVHLYPENQMRIGFRNASSAGVQPTISFVSAGTLGTAVSGSVTPGLPSGWAANDIHICVIESKDNVASTMPAGWTLLNAANSGTTHRATLYWRRAVAGDTNPLVTHSGGDSIVARIIGFRGVDTATAFDVANSFTVSGPDLTTEAAGITTVSENAMLVFTAHMADNHSSIGLPTPGTWTQAMFSATGNGSDSAIAAHYSNLISPPGAMAAVTATRSGGANVVSHGAQLALRPAPVALTINKPTGTVADDVMIASVALRPHTVTITPPSGWTLVRRIDNANSWANSLAVYRKVAGASEPASYAWTFGSVAMATGGIQSFYNVDTTNPIDAEDGQTTPNGTAHATPGITTTVPNAMLVTSHGVSNPGPNHWTASPVGSRTEAYDAYGGAEAIAGYYVLQAAAGPTGAQQATSAVADSGNAHILALRPKATNATLTVQLLHNAAVIGSGTVDVSGGVALASVSFATTAVTFADNDRLHVKVIAPNDPANVNARVSYDGASQQSRAVTPALSCDVAEPVYAAATASSGQVTTYWSSANPVIVLEKPNAAISEVPVNRTTYAVGATVGGATVRASTAAGETSLTRTGLSAGTPYYYKVFAKNAAGCYALGTEVDGTPPSGTRPSWSYMHAGGSMLKPGITGIGSIYTGSNASRMISLDTSTGLHKWNPVSTTQPVQGWLSWVPNNGYSYRQTITVTADTPGAPTGYSVPITLDHAGLVAAGKSRADGNDVRVVYWNGASGIELDRVLDSGSAWNTSSTKIWIRTQAAIAASGSDSSYHLYYGNATAGSPPANKSNVFLFWDDFETGNLSKWTASSGSLWQAATDQRHAGTYALKYPTQTAALHTLEANPALDEPDVYFEAWWRFANNTVSWVSMDVRWGATDNRYLAALEPNAAWTIGQLIGGAWTEYGTNQGVNSINTWHRIGTAVNDVRSMRVFQNNAQISPAAGATLLGTTLASGNVGFTKYDLSSGSWWLDDVVVRKYVNPEPVTTLALEQAETWGSIVGGDQSGRVYSVDAVVGTANWTTDLSAKADAIQAGVAAQMWSYSDAAFQAAYTTDVLFAASRNTGATNCGTPLTNNKLFALRADTGAVLWTFNDTCTYPIDYIVGMPYVDYARNRIYLATRGLGSTLWILSTLDGSVVQELALGNIDMSPAVNSDGSTIYVSRAGGTLYAVNTTTFTRTSIALGSPVRSLIWEDWGISGRLYFTTTDGNVWCLQHHPDGTFTQVWKIPVAGASAPLLLDRLYVGSSDGRLHEFDTDGGNEKVFPATDTLDGTTVGDISTEDGSHVFVGTNGGKLFKIQVPLP